MSPAVSAPNPIVEVAVAGGRTVRVGQTLPLTFIAGPCQMESRAHALEMAHALREIADRIGAGLIF